jgi:hypothetical protein
MTANVFGLLSIQAFNVPSVELLFYSKRAILLLKFTLPPVFWEAFVVRSFQAPCIDKLDAWNKALFQWIVSSSHISFQFIQFIFTI